MLDNELLNKLAVDPQEVLMGSFRIKAKTQEIFEKIQKLRAAAENITQKISEDGSFGGGFSNSKTENYAIEIYELEQLLKEQISLLDKHEMRVIEITQAMIDDPKDKYIVRARYVYCRGWRKIAGDLNCTTRALFKRNVKIFEEISKKALTFASKCDNI